MKTDFFNNICQQPTSRVPSLDHRVGAGEQCVWNRDPGSFAILRFADSSIKVACRHFGGHTMKIPRRTFLHLAAGAAALPAISRFAEAQNYPTRPVRLIVGFAPGGSTDILARLLAQWLSERLGQQFVVENRAGAGTNIATESVVNSPPDGYALLLTTGANFINATLYPDLKFNFARDLAPISLLTLEPNVMVVHPSVPANSLAEFIAYLKANPGKVTMASGGNGAPSHISGEMFKMLAGVDMVHVPYRGAGPALIDMLSGQAQVYFSPLSATIGYIRAGTLRALGVTTENRSGSLADIPAIRELVPGYDATRCTAWSRRKTRRLRSSTSSTRRSTRFSPIPQRLPDLPSWASRRSADRPPISASASPTKPRSGARSSSSLAPRWTDRVG